MNKQFLNKQFGKLHVISFDRKGDGGQTYWYCKCTCGKIISVRSDHLNRAKITTSCGCGKVGSNSDKWRGYGEITATQFNRYARDAKYRKLVFKLTIKEAWELFLSQNRKCKLTGEVITFAITAATQKDSTASLDRIDSSKGYIKSNIQWVHKDINRMKWDLPQVRFKELCKKVSDYKLPM